MQQQPNPGAPDDGAPQLIDVGGGAYVNLRAVSSVQFVGDDQAVLTFPDGQIHAVTGAEAVAAIRLATGAPPAEPGEFADPLAGVPEQIRAAMKAVRQELARAAQAKAGTAYVQRVASAHKLLARAQAKVKVSMGTCASSRDLPGAPEGGWV